MVKNRDRIIISALSLFTLIWGIYRYISGGHIVYYPHSDAWWVQGGVGMAHFDAGDFNSFQCLMKNIIVFLKEGKRAYIVGIGLICVYCIISFVLSKLQKKDVAIS
jgi:hypothetical protein